MNWNEATLEQCRDFLAECKGWTKHLTHWHDDREGMEGLAHVQHSEHPITATLDSIAASLPEGWRWTKIEYIFGGTETADVYLAQCENFIDLREVEAEAEVSNFDNMIPAMTLSMARCACLAWEASGK